MRPQPAQSNQRGQSAVSSPIACVCCFVAVFTTIATIRPLRLAYVAICKLGKEFSFKIEAGLGVPKPMRGCGTGFSPDLELQSRKPDFGAEIDI